MTKSEYDEIKARVEREWGRCIRDPKTYGGPKLTLEETAVMLAPGPDSVLSKMTVLKAEQSGLAKLRAWMKSKGVSSMDDVRGSRRECASRTESRTAEY